MSRAACGATAFTQLSVVATLVLLLASCASWLTHECIQTERRYVCRETTCNYRDSDGRCTSRSSVCGMESVCLRWGEPLWKSDKQQPQPKQQKREQNEIRSKYAGRFRYDLGSAPGWRKAPNAKHTQWEVHLEYEPDLSTLGGFFRVYLLHSAFGYDPARHADHWDYLSQNVVPGVVTPVSLKPYPGLKLPPGWEARTSGWLLEDRGRTIWIGRRYGDIVFMYVILVNPHSPSAPLPSDHDRYMQRHHLEIEQMVAKTRISVHQ